MPDDPIDDLRRAVPKELRESIGDALHIDLTDLDTAEGIRALANSLVRREMKRLTAVLEAGDEWVQRKDAPPEPALKDPKEEARLDELAKGRKWVRRALESKFGPRSGEEARLRKELRELEMSSEEYLTLVQRLANAVQRQLVIAEGGDCPVCEQYVVNPASRPFLRWLSRGLVNTGRSLLFLIELAVVVCLGGGVVVLLARLLGLWELD